MQSNPYLTRVGELEMLSKFPRKESLGSTGGSGGPRRSSGWGGGSLAGGSVAGGGGSGASTPTSTHAGSMSAPATQGLPLSALQHVFRDSRAAPLGAGPGDLVVRHARQMLATRQQDKHGE